ncbi:MAG: hypothetical protein AB8B55_23440 [Mariniblastus sp.]
MPSGIERFAEYLWSNLNIVAVLISHLNILICTRSLFLKGPWAITFGRVMKSALKVSHLHNRQQTMPLNTAFVKAGEPKQQQI